MVDRLPHCTPSAWSDHSPLCDRDGRFCSQSSSHAGECTPHGRHVHVNLDASGHCVDCGTRVLSSFRGFPLPDRDELERGTGPDRYPTILRDDDGRPVDVG